MAEEKMPITDSVGMNLSRLQGIVEEREAWREAVHGVAESDTTYRLNTTTIARRMAFNLCCPETWENVTSSNMVENFMDWS